MGSFGNMEVMQNILRDSEIGLWCVEIEKVKALRMYVDDTFCEIQGMEHSLSPEENYVFWYERIEPSDLKIVDETVKKMSQNTHAEV